MRTPFAAACLVLACLGLLLNIGHAGIPAGRLALLVAEPRPESGQHSTHARLAGDSGGQNEATTTTYYVRPDGGSPGQCTGRVNAPYPGSGASQSCAWDHPFRALAPGGPARISGGDTLIIEAGSYMMGYGAPEAD